MDAATSDGLLEKGATMETTRYVAEPLRLKTMSMRACSLCPFTTRVRAGTSCSMNTLLPLSLSRLLGIWPLPHACDQRYHQTSIHNSGAAVDPLVWSRLGPLRFCWAGLSHICSIGSCRMWQHQSPGHDNTETAVLSLVRFAAWLHEMGSGV